MAYPSYNATDTYHYDSQIRQYLVQFMAIFAGLKVSVGTNDSVQQTKLITVPVRYGNSDRVVDAIKSDNTTNKPIRLPTMAANLIGLQMSPEARKGVGVVERYSHLERGRSFPDGLKVISRMQPVPYMAIFELAIMTSNTDHHYQILEQLLTLFNPDIQIQTNDDVHDWKRITTVELTNVGLEENYPAGTDNRIIKTSLTFAVQIYLAPPTMVRNNYIAAIKMRLAGIAGDSKVTEIVGDITREFPDYETIVSADEFEFPES